MKNKLFIVFLCCITILFCLSSCGKPEISEYYEVSCNIVWNEARKIDSEFPSIIYYEIEGVPTNQYIACKWRESFGIGVSFYPRLLQHKDNEGKWEFDVSSAKLIISKRGINEADDKAWRTYGQSIVVQEVCPIDYAIAEQLANDILSDSPIYADRNFYGEPFLLDSDLNYLSLHFTLKEYSSLSFVANILKNGEKYYIEIKEDVYISRYLLCSDEFASLLDKVCIEYDLSTNH